MKTFSVLFILLAGCLQVNDDSESDSEDSSFEDYSSYEDLERRPPVKDNGCPTYYQKVIIDGRQFLIEVPSECHLNYIEKGRPSDDNYLVDELILEEPYSTY